MIVIEVSSGGSSTGGRSSAMPIIVHWNLADEVDLRHRFLLGGAIVRVGFIPSRPSRQRLWTHLVVKVLGQLVLVSCERGAGSPLTHGRPSYRHLHWQLSV